MHSEPARPEQKEVLAHVLTNKGDRSTPVLGCPTRKHRRGSNPPPWSMNLAHVIEMITSAFGVQPAVFASRGRVYRLKSEIEHDIVQLGFCVAGRCPEHAA